MNRSWTKSMRRRVIGEIDRRGQRQTVAEWYGRLSPSRTVRRDHRDMDHLRTVIAASLGGGDRIGVDIGANVGVVAAMMFQVAPDVQHVLVEPVADLAAGLRQRFPLADVVEAVCGSRAGEASFHVAVNQPTRSSVHVSMAETGGEIVQVTVPAVRLDDMVGSRSPGLIKIDVEGGELAVLEGAVSVLTTTRPLVVFEHARASAVSASMSREIHRLLTGVAYRVFNIDGGGPLDESAFVAQVDRGQIWTFIAVAHQSG